MCGDYYRTRTIIRLFRSIDLWVMGPTRSPCAMMIICAPKPSASISRIRLLSVAFGLSIAHIRRNHLYIVFNWFISYHTINLLEWFFCCEHPIQDTLGFLWYDMFQLIHYYCVRWVIKTFPLGLFKPFRWVIQPFVSLRPSHAFFSATLRFEVKQLGRGVPTQQHWATFFVETTKSVREFEVYKTSHARKIVKKINISSLS